MQGRAIGWVLAGVVCLLTLGTFGKARAVDFTLPGERRIEVHGFFETRLSFVGDDFNGQIDLARLWNLLNVEADVEIFPDGIGPFQSISGFARFLASYECVYSHGCGAFRSADSFGDRVNVMPAQLRPGQFINRSATIPVGVDPGNNGSSRALSSYLGGTAFPNSFNDMENFLPYIDVFGLASTPQYVAGYTNGTNISFYPAFDLNVVGGNPQSNVADLTGILQSADNLDPYRSRPPMP
jgi:hypothetical protein